MTEQHPGTKPPSDYAPRHRAPKKRAFRSTAPSSVKNGGGSSQAARARSSQKGPNRLLPLLLVLAGVLVVLYPVIATQYNNARQHEFSQRYNSEVSKIDTTERDAELERAREYNGKINGIPILDPYLDGVEHPESEAYTNYLSQLDQTEVMARVRVPEVSIDLPVRHGTTESSIRNGAGHLYGTSLPVGGEGTHSVLTSHTGISEATLFDRLIDVDKGDLIFIDVYGQTLAYRVDQIKVVLPEEIGDLQPIAGHDYLTLFTCTPYAVNSHRLLVRAERIDWSPALEQEEVVESPWYTLLRPWMWALVGVALVGFIAAVSMLLALLRSRRRKDREQADDQAIVGLEASDGSGEGAEGAAAGAPKRRRIRRS